MSSVLRSLRTAGIGTTAAVIGAYTAPAVTTGVVISGLTLANQIGSVIAVTCYINSGGTNYYLCVGAGLLPGGSLTLADEGNRIVLNSGDTVVVQSNTAASVTAIMSVAEIT